METQEATNVQILSKIVEYAGSFLGAPYIYGGNGPQGIDCSGLVCECLKSVGIMPSKMDKKAQDLHHYLQHSGWLNINSPKYAREGTIIFFGKDDKSIKHVAISIGLGLMIEAGGGGENCITMEDSIKYNAFVRIRPITSRLDFLCVLTPAF